MARVGIDLDGVLYQFHCALREFMCDLGFSMDDMPDPAEWSFGETWGLNGKGFKMVCDLAADQGRLWNYHKASDADVSALHRLVANGHTIHIVTARDFGTRAGVTQAATLAWLKGNDIPFDSITFSTDKTVVKLDYMIEDNVENHLALHRVGVESVLLTQPWNRHLPATRVATVSEFVDFVLHPDPMPF
ncbi:phosphohydrolase [Gordonia phage Daredevil]|uniref:5' nucleotidase n=1 Tax=Gordonia phage Daredevil TaxID=2283286 RepID=A0A345MIW8_9CAUD|nr:phosphohydrolase [Gordonia phage Daredevil]AXH70499.1 5' nucleotidase [Gordonia phage Daredevil]